MKPTTAEFLRAYRHEYGPMTAFEAKRAVERLERRSQYSTLAEQRAYELARDASCRFCLDLPVQNASTWLNDIGLPTAACPRCGEAAKEAA